VNRYQIGSPPRGVEWLAGTLRQDLDRGVGGLREPWQDRLKQPRIVHRGCRRENNNLRGIGDVRRGCDDEQQRGKRVPNEAHDEILSLQRGERPSSAKAAVLTSVLIPINTSASPRAGERLPLLVSSATAVVIVRV